MGAMDPKRGHELEHYKQCSSITFYFWVLKLIKSHLIYYTIIQLFHHRYLDYFPTIHPHPHRRTRRLWSRTCCSPIRREPLIVAIQPERKICGISKMNTTVSVSVGFMWVKITTRFCYLMILEHTFFRTIFVFTLLPHLDVTSKKTFPGYIDEKWTEI